MPVNRGNYVVRGRTENHSSHSDFWGIKSMSVSHSAINTVRPFTRLVGRKSAKSHRLGVDRNLVLSTRARNALHRELSLVQAICDGRKGRRRPGPEQIINSCEERKISSKRGKVSEEKG